MFNQNQIYIYRSDSRCVVESDLSVHHVSPILYVWNRIYMYVNPILLGILSYRIDVRESRQCSCSSFDDIFFFN
jgi:hypothetical protein